MINRIGINSQIATPTQQKKAQNVQKEEKTGRVDEIKKQIENGEYKIDINKTAAAMAKSLL